MHVRLVCHRMSSFSKTIAEKSEALRCLFQLLKEDTRLKLQRKKEGTERAERKRYKQ